ncbi:hypothetical protein LCGC14_0965890 [marine sediment metagenome]|uniref:RecA family profile 1 domain-containing protein n=1 Tax=marine sediment metagenome TaxID=412755 RepID=A0A0F9QWC7_9ZZZZ
MEVNEILKIKSYQIIIPKKNLDEFKKEKSRLLILPSGSNNFDEILGGGFRQGTTYLIFGANRTGKTQLSHQLCIHAFNNFSKLFKSLRIKHLKFVYYFDTENTFRPERLKELAVAAGFEDIKILESILVSKIMSNSAFLLSLKNLEKIVEKSHVAVLIIDTINNHYNSELADKTLSFNKAKERFLKILIKINTLTKKYNLITIVLAQVTSNLGKEIVIPVLPVGNQILNHFFSEYIFLEYKNENQRYIHIVNSLNLPEKRLQYKITSAGIQDYEI